MGAIGNDWDDVLSEYFSSQDFAKLNDFLAEEYNSNTIFPPKQNLFLAYKLTEYKNVKAVIIGQDPYHTKGMAQGICFSVPNGSKSPPSLRNIFKELESDTGISHKENSELSSWANSGVLMINAVLTVREGEANSHKNKGWEIFTKQVILSLDKKDSPIVFILWGKNAESFAKYIKNSRHLILTAPHPSPLSAHAGFFGCRHFSRTNDFLSANGLSPISW